MTHHSLPRKFLTALWRIAVGASLVLALGAVQTQLPQLALSWREVFLLASLPVVLYLLGYLLEYAGKGLIGRYHESNSTRSRRSERREL